MKKLNLALIGQGRSGRLKLLDAVSLRPELGLRDGEIHVERNRKMLQGILNVVEVGRALRRTLLQHFARSRGVGHAAVGVGDFGKSPRALDDVILPFGAVKGHGSFLLILR